jgi:hypothetical protein
MKALVVDLSLSSDEEDLITNVSPDEEFARRLSGELNHNDLGPPVTARSSFSTSPMKKKRRCARRRLSLMKLRHLLLQGPRPQPPLLMTPMAPTRVMPLIG